MVDIKSFGTYIPRYRLGKDTSGWGSSSEKAIANFDEDSVTMAVAAGRHCLSNVDRSKIDGLLFATTTPPYVEKQNASIIASALDLRRDIFAADVTGVLKSATTAVKMAMDSINAGSANEVLVLSADTRLSGPRGDLERHIGDGAVALLISNSQGMATIEGTYSITENMLDTWRSQGDLFLRTWEDRFTNEEGLDRIVKDAVAGFNEKYELSPADIDRIALYAPNDRRHSALGRSMGFSVEQLQDPLFGTVGNTGAAHPLMLLVGALEELKEGSLILVASYGDGSDVLSLRVKKEHNPKTHNVTLRQQIESKKILPNYETYTRWRDVWTSDAAARRPPPSVPSVTVLWREANQILRLHGAKCRSCGCIQYPPQRVCAKCQGKDQFDSYPLANIKGNVFTYSMDYLAGTVDLPLVNTVVDFQGGGRMYCMMTDRELDEVRVGMPVDMSFRKLRIVNGIHNYFWKSIPER